TCIEVSHESSEETNAFRVFCAHGKGPCDCRATNNFDEIAPVHHGPRRSGSDKVSVTAQINTLEGAELPQWPLWVKSRHVLCTSSCPLWAKSGHEAHQLSALARKANLPCVLPNKLESADLPVCFALSGHGVYPDSYNGRLDQSAS